MFQKAGERMLSNIIAVAVILSVVGCAAAYIIREKKKGKKCIGCPYSGSCGKAEKCDITEKTTCGCDDSCLSDKK